MVIPIDGVVLKCRKNLSDGKSAKPCVIYSHTHTQKKFRFPVKSLLLLASCPKCTELH